MADNLLRETAKEVALAERITFRLQNLFEGIGTIADDHLPVAEGEEPNERHVRVLPHPFYVE